MLASMISSSLAARRRLVRLHRDGHGAAIVEFALVVPVLFLVVFAVIDFGRALWTVNVLTSGVREGARFGAVQATTTLAADSAKWRASQYINGVLGTALTAGDFNVSYDATTGSTTYGQIRVRLVSNFVFTPVTPFAAQMGLGNITFAPDASYRWERAN